MITSGLWVSAFAAERVRAPEGVVRARAAILDALALLVLALAVLGGSAGRTNASVVRAGAGRTAIANVPLVRVPCVVFLGVRSGTGDLGAPLATVRVIELAAYTVGAALLAPNMRAEIAMRGRRTRARPLGGIL